MKGGGHVFEIFPPALVFGLLAAAVTTLGLIGVVLTGDWARKQSGVLAAFAAGALMCVIILHLLPEAMATSPHAPGFMLAGFAGAYLLNRGVLAFAHSPKTEKLASGVAPMLAIGLHSFIDGATYSVTFSFDWLSGAMTAIGLISHEAPEGIIVFTLLHRAGFSLRHAFWLAFLAAAATTPLGAAAAQPLVSGLPGAALGDVFALVAGLLLYVGAGHLLPHVEREPARKALPALAVGALVAIGAERLHADGHDHHNHNHDPHAGHDHAQNPRQPDFSPQPVKHQ